MPRYLKPKVGAYDYASSVDITTFLGHYDTQDGSMYLSLYVSLSVCLSVSPDDSLFVSSFLCFSSCASLLLLLGFRAYRLPDFVVHRSTRDTTSHSEAPHGIFTNSQLVFIEYHMLGLLL